MCQSYMHYMHITMNVLAEYHVRAPQTTRQSDFGVVCIDLSTVTNGAAYQATQGQISQAPEMPLADWEYLGCSNDSCPREHLHAHI